MTALEIAAALIRSHEGLRLSVYDDATGKPLEAGCMLQGHATIGYGRNLGSGRGISRAEAEVLLAQDLVVAKETAREFVGGLVWQRLNPPRQAVLIDMAHNLGPKRLLGFVKFQQALGMAAYDIAAEEMLDSLWARQVGDRARALAAIMVSGIAPEDVG